MFDLGFSELLVVAVVALIVLGPERLPKAARFAGLWVRKARAQWYSVKSEFEREMASDELKRSVGNPAQDLRKELASVGQAVSDEVRDLDAIARADADTAVQDIPPENTGPEPEFYSDPEPFRLVPDEAPAEAPAESPERREPPQP